MKHALLKAAIFSSSLFILAGCEQAVEQLVLTQMEQQQSTRDMLFETDKIRIVTCGTSSPIPSGSAVESCTAVFINEQFLLFDAGNGSLNSMENSMLPLAEISAIFLTHFHSDHWADLAEVIDRSWIMGRRSITPIYGGPGVEQIVDDTTKAYSLEYSYRTAHHGEDYMPPEWVGVNPTTINVSGENTTVVYENDGVVVTAFNVNHPPIEPSLGFKITYAGKTIVISGDTTETPALATQSANADVLVSEVMNMEYVQMAEKIFTENGYDANAKIFHDIQDYHIGTEQLAELAEEASVKHLVLTHLAPNFDSDQVMDTLFANPIKKIYKGDLSVARDGDIYEVELE